MSLRSRFDDGTVMMISRCGRLVDTTMTVALLVVSGPVVSALGPLGSIVNSSTEPTAIGDVGCPA